MLEVGKTAACRLAAPRFVGLLSAVYGACCRKYTGGKVLHECSSVVAVGKSSWSEALPIDGVNVVCRQHFARFVDIFTKDVLYFFIALDSWPRTGPSVEANTCLSKINHLRSAKSSNANYNERVT